MIYGRRKTVTHEGYFFSGYGPWTGRSVCHKRDALFALRRNVVIQPPRAHPLIPYVISKGCFDDLNAINFWARPCKRAMFEHYGEEYSKMDEGPAP